MNTKRVELGAGVIVLVPLYVARWAMAQFAAQQHAHTATLRALCVPRRAVPLAVVAVGLLTSEWLASGSRLACGIDLALFVAFCAVAPASWRWAAAPFGSRKLRS